MCPSCQICVNITTPAFGPDGYSRVCHGTISTLRRLISEMGNVFHFTIARGPPCESADWGRFTHWLTEASRDVIRFPGHLRITANNINYNGVRDGHKVTSN